MYHKYYKEYKEIKNLITKSNKIIIIPHIDPDPDALSSAYTLAYLLNKQGKKTKVGLNNNLNKKNTEIFEEYQSYNITNNKEIYDLAIVVDIGSKSRMGKYSHLLESNCKIINLDHHIDNKGFGDISIVDEKYSSTSELIYELLTEIKLPLNQKVAETLYTGIVSDSGSFRYDLTTPKTHYYTSKLLEYKINTNKIYQKLFENHSYKILLLKCHIIKTLKLLHNEEIALSYISQETLEKFNINEKDNMTLIKIGSSIKGVCFAIFLNEKDNNTIRVSLRSTNKTRVNKIAQIYGGGGHQKAAGFTVKSNNFHQTMNILKKELVEHYKEEKSKLKNNS